MLYWLVGSHSSFYNLFFLSSLRSKGDKVIEASPDKYRIDNAENKLFIYKAGDEDAGEYTCQAVNAKTNTTEPVMKATIQVIGKS